MSRIFWSESAEADFDEIGEYIARDNPKAAIVLCDEIERRLRMLSDKPLLGRPGRIRGTREMVLTGTPFIAVYRVGRDEIVILRILHGARQWPPNDE